MSRASVERVGGSGAMSGSDWPSVIETAAVLISWLYCVIFNRRFGIWTYLLEHTRRSFITIISYYCTTGLTYLYAYTEVV